MLKDEREKRIKEAMQRFYEAQTAESYNSPLIRHRNAWRRDKRIMCKDEQCVMELTTYQCPLVPYRIDDV